MKNFLIVIALLFACNSNAQVSKADFELTFSKFPFANMTSLNIKNDRTYYTNGTSAIVQNDYKSDIFTYELTTTALHLYFYADNTKTQLNGVMIFPYNMIIKMSANKSGMTLELIS